MSNNFVIHAARDYVSFKTMYLHRAIACGDSDFVIWFKHIMVNFSSERSLD